LSQETVPDYADASIWDERHLASAQPETGRGPMGKWLAGVVSILDEHGVRALLDLGCGDGGDALALARRGMEITGVDHSQVAIDRARGLAEAERLAIDFLTVDVGQPLPFRDGRFDAVMSNLVLHSFPERVLRRILAEVWRCLGPGGLLLFHANSTEDVPYRTRVQPIVRELEPDFYELAGGQTMHFFSEEYCRRVLSAWSVREVVHLRTVDPAGSVVKCAWRCVAQRPV